MDCTNSNMNSGTMDYFAEVHGLYTALALQENRPVDFVDEDVLVDPAALAKYRVLFLTEPNLPAAAAAGLLAWAKSGGTLLTTSNAGHFDEYDEPAPVFHAALGTAEVPRNRTLFGAETFAYQQDSAAVWQKNGTASLADGGGHFAALGAISSASGKPKGTILAKFNDGTPATVMKTLGKGRSVHFFWLPGVSHSAVGPETGALKDASRLTIGKMLADMTGEAPAVTTSMRYVETPLLLAPEMGAVVTLLNWANETVDSLVVNVSLDFAPTKVESVLHGPVQAAKRNGAGGQKKDGDLTLTIPLDSADILLFYK
jgi:hypothetical protein